LPAKVVELYDATDWAEELQATYGSGLAGLSGRERIRWKEFQPERGQPL
jgi:hypothetical protein